MNDMGVAIVNWNTRDLLRQCLVSVFDDGAIEVVVADNGSTDGSVEMVAREFPQVILLVNADNPGYGAAANTAIRRGSAPYVLALNSDTILRRGALRALAGYLDQHPRAAIVGPRLRNPDGSLQRSCFPFPGPFVPLIKRPPIATVVERLPRLRDRYVSQFDHNRDRRVPWVLGAALGIRRAAFDAVGGFDESFVMYFEEVDLCRRLQQAGWEIHFAPVTDVTHIGGASTRQQRAEMLVRLSLSSVAFHRRHRRGLSLAAAVAVERMIVGGRLLRDTLQSGLVWGEAARRQLRENRGVWREVLRHISQPTRRP